MYRKLQSFVQSVRIPQFLVTVLVLGGVFAFAFAPQPAQAHCDSEQGPVAGAALRALDENDVTIVLPYVSHEGEAELTAAFEHAAAVRPLGGEAQALADRYFVETAIRVHRVGEGASYTGVTDEPVPEAIAAADEAMASGSLDGVYAMLSDAMRAGIEEQLHGVELAREHAAAEGTVEANRERVEAELLFEKYIYALHLSITGPVGHEGEIEAGHAH